MNFKLWLNESRYNDLMSWLAPNGEFHPLINGTHSDNAGKHSMVSNPKDDLFKKGWMRVSYVHKTIYANNPYVPPNRIQIAELKELAMVRDHIHDVVYDNDNDDKIIWTKNDIF